MAKLLKRLELNGFKSFAAKTVFDFSHGITAVVGPNGSGKSNVIDAVRWLLGERDAKSLRGVKAEDLIFAGTAKKARLGLASASLHFDNLGNFFPAEFSEVVVRRQVARDGTNQYFLNDAEVRLRDITDFFAKARLGTKGMIVVTQGNSDVFIRATPSGRREMIEEMLGLREYQLKKSEAERRLKNTQINLDKVRALTEEILPHLRSLKRQTGRWEKRDTLAAELRTLENSFFGLEHWELARKIREVTDEIENRQGRRSVLEHERAEAEKELARVEASEPQERKQIQELKVRTGEVLAEQGQLQKDLGRLEAHMEIRVAQEAESVSFPRADVLYDLVRRLRAILNETSDREKAVATALREIDAILHKEPEATATTAPAQELVGEIERVNKRLAEIHADLVALREQEKNLEKNQEQFYRAFKDAVGRVEAAKDKIERWDAETQQRLFEKERLVFRIDEWEKQVRQAGRTPEEFETMELVEDAVFDRGAAEHRIFRLRGELAAIGEIDEALLKEARETEDRYQFLQTESSDLEKAKNDLKALILDLNEKITNEFTGALTHINDEFAKFFALMFGGGHAKLRLEVPKAKAKNGENGEEENKEGVGEGADMKDAVKIESIEEPAELHEGIEIDVKLPRKRVTALDMLSGGERSLVGLAALFAMISVSPPPFLVLDEIDAALDERNARRFAELLKEFAKETQFILVTHNRATMEAADILYGITLDEDGSSKAVSLRFESNEPAPAPA